MTEDRIRAALLAFVCAYGNVNRLDNDQQQVALFEAWLAAVDALGIVAEVPAHANYLMTQRLARADDHPYEPPDS